MSANQKLRPRRGPARSSRIRELESRTCRRCGAEPGRQCVTTAGTFSTRPHMERFYDAGGTPEQDRQRDYHMRVRREQRQRIFERYGTSCACCGTTENLSIDHINGEGYLHREEVGTGDHFYRWLIRNNLPDGFQALCRSCNTSKGGGEFCRLHDGYQPEGARRQVIRVPVDLLAWYRDYAASTGQSLPDALISALVDFQILRSADLAASPDKLAAA